MRTADFDTWAGLDGHETVLGGRVNGNGPVIVTKPRQFAGLGWLSADNVLLLAACGLLAGLAVAMGVVSWHAQYAFVFAVKHQGMASALEALGLDAGAVIFSVLGVAKARRGRRAVIERVLVCACAFGSAGMNLLGADLGSPRSVVVYVMPPVLFAAASDRFIAVIRHAALGTGEDPDSRSAWRVAGTGFLYLLRFALAPPSTARGARRALLLATPLPELAAVKAAVKPPPVSAAAAAAPTKKARLLALAREQHGPVTEIPAGSVTRIAAGLAAQLGMHPSYARNTLADARKTRGR